MQSTTQQRPTRRTKASAHSQATSFSPAAARLIEQIQTEARATLLKELSAKDAIVVLHPVDPATRYCRFDSEGDIYIRDQRGTSIYLRRMREEPESWRHSRHMAGKWHPSHWTGHQTLIDTNGKEWMNSFGHLVIDDFGNLVEVSE